jgi:hypothetical protein
MDDRVAALSPHSLSPLLAALTLAEEISRDISARQALLAPSPLRRALQRQSWQETAHAAVFRAALQCLPGRAACPGALEKSLRRYATQLHADIDRGNLTASLIGLHCVLEGLGAVALQPPPGQLAKLADRVVPVRSFILHQELGHQRLGQAWVRRLGAEPAGLDTALRVYGELAEASLQAGLDTLDCLAADRDYYQDAVRAHLRSTETLLRHRDAPAMPPNSIRLQTGRPR